MIYMMNIKKRITENDNECIIHIDITENEINTNWDNLNRVR